MKIVWLLTKAWNYENIVTTHHRKEIWKYCDYSLKHENMKKLLLFTIERKYDNNVITHQGTKVRPIVGWSRSVGMSW
jgi:hypothetical protein